MSNISCSICTELLKKTHKVCVTVCGHVFHVECIEEWLRRSRTCPQCRSVANPNSVIRVYLNFANTDEAQLNPVALVEELDDIKLQLNIKTAELDKANDDIMLARLTCAGQMSNIMKLESQTKKNKLLLSNYSDQLKLLKYQLSEMHGLQEKIKEQDQHIKTLTDLQTIISGTKSDYEKIVKSETNPKTLAVWVSALKRELMLCEHKRNDARTSLKSAQNDLRKEMGTNKAQRQRVKELESENYILKEKLKSITTERLDSTIIEGEAQPTTAKKTKFEPEEKQEHTSPKRSKYDMQITKNVMEQSAGTSDSPYLNIKASLIGFTSICKWQRKQAFKESNGNHGPHNNDAATTTKLKKLQISPPKKGTGAMPKNGKKLTSMKNQHEELLMAGEAIAFPSSSNDSAIYTEGPVCSKTLQLQQTIAQCANDNVCGSRPIDENLMPTSADTSNVHPMRSSSIETRLKSGRLRNFRINK